MGTCEWKLENEDVNSWESACGHLLWFEEGSPIENEMKFCPYCGRGLVLQEDCQHTETFVDDGYVCCVAARNRMYEAQNCSTEHQKCVCNSYQIENYGCVCGAPARS